MMQGPQSKTSQQLRNEREVRKYLDELGNSEAVARLIDRYGKVSTRRVYLVSLVLYFRWLKSLGVALSPDELVTDNLTCVFHSDPADVGTKRKQQIKTAIEARVQISKDKRYGIWTIGITDNPVRRQTEHDDEGKNTRYWLSWMADSEAIARNVEAFFIEKGMKGGVGGEMNGNFAYIF